MDRVNWGAEEAANRGTQADKAECVCGADCMLQGTRTRNESAAISAIIYINTVRKIKTSLKRTKIGELKSANICTINTFYSR